MKRICTTVGTGLGFSNSTQVSNGCTVEPSPRYPTFEVWRAPGAECPSWPKYMDRSTYTGKSVVTMVANSALGMMSLALSVMREFGVRRISNGVCLPSGETNRKCATVDTAFGFSSANHTSKGVRVLPSAKYHLRCSFGSGGDDGISAVA